MTTQSKTLVTDGVAATGIVALAVLVAIGYADMGKEVVLHLLHSFGTIPMVLIMGVVMTMAMVGVTALVSIALALGLAAHDGIRHLLPDREVRG